MTKLLQVADNKAGLQYNDIKKIVILVWITQILKKEFDEILCNIRKDIDNKSRIQEP